MASLTIPPNHIDSFLFLARLNAREFSTLKQVIFQERNLLGFGILSEAVSEKLKIANTEFQPVLSMLVSLYSLKESKSIGKQGDFLEMIIGALREDKDLGLKEKELEKLYERLSVLADDDSPLKFLYDSTTLHVDYERLLRNSGILTDLRPLFSKLDNSFDALRGGIVTHTLKLNMVQADGNVEEIYVALDSDDLMELHNQIEAALQKERLLKEYIGDKDLFYVDLSAD